ncbi:uncharacterized protein N7482_001245 [Penicillium canariense]|uniref:Uncharacterized protein n=1 Tax=Penicillium canariense TaxID=189055 RepID=A0A9W9LSR7_9EURO|nr:uncharacterized protein N7482_001245 [Penicillium canariense]KAJ5175368.1 hypothetical protein N7482_001245 [Penicillium canariense]
MDNGTSATDIITYIGVPLAVIGVLPILYTSFRALWTQRLIRSTLNRHGLLDSLTRVSLIGGIVEVELPRCSITPLDRESDAKYWKLNASHVPLKGGSWSMFHWNRLVTGRVMYRCQFKDELTIPQADIDFEELVAFLLDRGAVPDPHGWHILKTVGLWTPPGTAMLRPPRGMSGAVLTVAPPDDSDGVLSLQVNWEVQWDQRNSNSLPPFWTRLEQPRSVKADSDEGIFSASMKELKGAAGSEIGQGKTLSRQNTLVADSIAESSSSKPFSLLTEIEEMKALVTKSDAVSVRFKIDHDHVKRVIFECDSAPTGEPRDLSSLGDIFGLWLACTASALSQDGDSGLWNFAIPSHIAEFTRQKSIPCGVMVVLGLLSEDNVPPWASPPPSTVESRFDTQQRMEEDSLARRMEGAMPPVQAAEARRVRMLRESQRFHQSHLRRLQAQEEYQQRRLIEAIQSPRLDNQVIAEANLAYLVSQDIVPSTYTLRDLAQAVLYLMILDEGQAKLISDILERWMLWCQFGGMQKVQLTLLMENKVAFCYASALVAVVQRANSAGGNLSSDMLDCMRSWKRVRLG